MQKIGNSFKRQIIFSILLISIFLTLTCSKTTQTTIYRDTWGIPHIYSNSEANLAFAFGYAQAEDRLIQILRSYRYAEGTLAEAFGENYVESSGAAQWRDGFSNQRSSRPRRRLRTVLSELRLRTAQSV